MGVLGLILGPPLEYRSCHGIELLVSHCEVVRSIFPHPLQKVAGTGGLVQKSSPELISALLAFCLVKVGTCTEFEGVIVLGAILKARCRAIDGGDVGVVTSPVEPSLVCEAETLDPVDEYVEVCSSVGVSLSPNETEAGLAPSRSGDEVE